MYFENKSEYEDFLNESIKDIEIRKEVLKEIVED